MYDTGYDLEVFDQQTKVSYARVRAIFPFKARDTVTRVARRQVALSGPGSPPATVLVLHAVQHRGAPPDKAYVRAKIMRGVHCVQPLDSNRRYTNFTFTQHVDCGGIIPAWVMNMLVTVDSVQFVQRLGKAAASEDWR